MATKSSFDLIIKNSKILHGGQTLEVDICVNDGRIAKISSESVRPSGATIVDANGMLVLPGLVDPHVHFRDPGLTQKEDFVSGTKGAAAGGVTTVFDMPTTQPVVTGAPEFEEKLKIVKDKAVTNFALFGAAGPTNLDNLEGLAKAGVIGFKTYMVSPPRDRIKEYAGSYVTSTGDLYRVMSAIKKTGLVHAIHAESDSTIGCLTEELHSEGRKDPMAHYDSRPNFTEAEAVYDSILLSEALCTKIHLVHVSTSEAVRLLAGAKARGADVSGETCPHYLCFSKEILNERGPYAKYNPPARNKEDLAALLGALNSDTIGIVSTDHAPHTREEKEEGREDIFKAPPGTPGVETRLAILLKMVHEGRLRLEDIPKLGSEAAAKRFGLYPRKGTISEGSDADITIVDFNEEWVIKAADLQTKAWETVLFDGMRVFGKVKYTIVNGRVAYEEGAGFAKAGSGEFLRGVGA